MASAWLAIGGMGPDGRAARFDSAGRWLPFVPVGDGPCGDGPGGDGPGGDGPGGDGPGGHHAIGQDDSALEIRVWSVCDESTRGAPIDTKHKLVFDGWYVENENVDLAASVASTFAATLPDSTPPAHGRWPTHDGQFSFCRHDGTAVVAGSGMMQGFHVYLAEHAGVFALSNRAMMAAAAVHGELPSPDLAFLSWQLTGVVCPFGSGSCWPGVRLLPDREVAVMTASGIDTVAVIAQPTALNHAPQPDDWDREAEALKRRVAQLKRLPSIRKQMAVTGGKDSRLVLAAAMASGVTDTIDTFYLKAVDGHPDAHVGGLLTQRIGRELTLIAPPQATEDVFAAVRAHLFCAEVAVGPWDHKAAAHRPAVAGIHGNYGEIFKSHIKPSFLLGWPIVRRFYRSEGWLNPFGLLPGDIVATHRLAFEAFVDTCRADGTELADVHDRWHREARMGRWLGQTLQFDACGAPAINVLPSHDLLALYLALPWRDRRDHVVHLELMRRLDNEIWQLPLANDTWKRRINRGYGRPQAAYKANVLAVSSQLAAYNRQREAINAYIIDGEDDGFFDVVRRDAVTSYLAKVAAKPSARLLNPVFTLLGMRMAAREGLTPAPFTVG